MNPVQAEETRRDPALPAELVAEIIGARGPAEEKFTAQALEALARISPDLVPRLASRHPLRDEILAGVAAYPRLIARLAAATTEREQVVALDAIAEIIRRHHPTLEVVAALTDALSSAPSPEVASTAARALALAREPGFLEAQRQALSDRSPTRVSTAARLLGMGRYEPAIPELLALLRPDRMMTVDVVVAALGEMEADEALPALHRMLFAGVESLAVVEALGRIGSVASLPILLACLEVGANAHREGAVLAIARILRKNQGQLFDEELARGLRATLERRLDEDGSPLARFYALLGISLLGGRLSPKRILRALGAQLGQRELDALANFHTRRRR